MGNLVTVNVKLAESRRLRLGLLRGELAERSGLHINTLRAALGGGPVGVRTVRKLAGGLGVDYAALVIVASDDRPDVAQTPSAEPGAVLAGAA
jgi:transcriptional regulator with XRE-family HTH domain